MILEGLGGFQGLLPLIISVTYTSVYKEIIVYKYTGNVQTKSNKNCLHAYIIRRKKLWKNHQFLLFLFLALFLSLIMKGGGFPEIKMFKKHSNQTYSYYLN